MAFIYWLKFVGCYYQILTTALLLSCFFIPKFKLQGIPYERYKKKHAENRTISQIEGWTLNRSFPTEPQ